LRIRKNAAAAVLADERGIWPSALDSGRCGQVGNRPRYQGQSCPVFLQRRCRFVFGRRGVECPRWIFRTIYDDFEMLYCRTMKRIAISVIAFVGLFCVEKSEKVWLIR